MASGSSAAPKRKSKKGGAKKLGVGKGDPYKRFRQIDGTHPYQQAVPEGYVSYQVRTRAKGEVFYFNFALAKEMGLIPKDHNHKTSSKLKENILDTFSLVIINEYDQVNKRKFDPETIKPNRYMATKYLQLQHHCKKGTTSGDGRGIWNGCVTHKGVTWDVSSCGTGVTCLSPAAAASDEPLKTGDQSASYGSGYSHPIEGVSSAIMSEIFFQNGIETERVLAIISYPDGSSLTVRAAQSLLRPSHFFGHLKQENYENLKGAIDFYIDRQVDNGEWKKLPSGKKKYDKMASLIAKSFARTTALFESEYIFCWLDWDGDNILVNGGIIDYGSVRQFGMFHHKYR